MPPKKPNRAVRDVRHARFLSLLETVEARGITQTEMARRSGLAAAYICDLKKGRRHTTELAARRLAETFGVSKDWLLGNEFTEDGKMAPEAQTFEERVVERAQAMIISACSETPELRQVAVIFDWERNLNRGTTPFVVGDAQGPLHEQELGHLHGMLEQTSKLVSYLGQLLLGSLQHYNKVCTQMEERIRVAQQEAEAEQAGPEQGEEAPDREPDTPEAAEGTEDRPG